MWRSCKIKKISFEVCDFFWRGGLIFSLTHKRAWFFCVEKLSDFLVEVAWFLCRGSVIFLRLHDFLLLLGFSIFCVERLHESLWEEVAWCFWVKRSPFFHTRSLMRFGDFCVEWLRGFFKGWMMFVVERLCDFFVGWEIFLVEKGCVTLCMERLHDFCVSRGYKIFLAHSLTRVAWYFFFWRLHDFCLWRHCVIFLLRVCDFLCEEVAWFSLKIFDFWFLCDEVF